MNANQLLYLTLVATCTTILWQSSVTT